MVRSSTRFSMFSIFQLNSPSAAAPTSRPEPFSVWNERRTFLSVSRSSGLAFHAGRLTLMLAISSPTSSTKTSRISSSMPAASWNDVSTGAAPSASAGSSTSSSTSTQWPGPTPGIACPACTVSVSLAAATGMSTAIGTPLPIGAIGAGAMVAVSVAATASSAAAGSARSRRAGSGQYWSFSRLCWAASRMRLSLALESRPISR